jgi:hypothetical protein
MRTTIFPSARASDLEDDYRMEMRDEMIDEELLSEVGRGLQEL